MSVLSIAIALFLCSNIRQAHMKNIKSTRLREERQLWSTSPSTRYRTGISNKMGHTILFYYVQCPDLGLQYSFFLPAIPFMNYKCLEHIHLNVSKGSILYIFPRNVWWFVPKEQLRNFCASAEFIDIT